MENNFGLRQEIAAMRQSFFNDGILSEQFVQVEQLGDDDPHFLERLLTVYFRESTQSIAALENALELPSCNLRTLERPFHKFKGASASIGAVKVTREIDLAIQACRDDDVDGAKAAVERINNEYVILRRRLGDYFQIMRQVGPYERAVRPR
ncbi:pseudo histidine-containing phosphotransfer protein 2-like [Benincasa hispida]|uniref:pseudo histidine-containing phosphotransfer protein 2-like n=1 Tax=Benincasa hispida TaxID=102211 RepID=UPI0019019996|nr:pseudo histidine-containing phosphotransfer protein 2-like [Benincasa hispida]